jgi:hypothetical protein
LKERDNLHPEKTDDGRHYLSLASYTLSKEEKESMFCMPKQHQGPIWILFDYKGYNKCAREEIPKLKVS